MGSYSGPDVSESGLVLALDGGSLKSFKGTPAINLLYSLTDTNGTINNSNFKTSYGNETVFIPSLGYKTVRYCNIYNDYSTSGICCPRLFDYGGNVVSQNITVSPSTTYTYEIIYKVASGYTNANYMYRYEYNGGTYVTEAGVHSDVNRTSLGDGWYHAWGQFTTQATTNNLWLTGMWYYQYSVYDKVSVASVSLHQGTYIIPPEHMLLPQENRGKTVATGGGWSDLSGKSNNGTLESGVSYSSSNGGALVFDGTDDYVSAPNTSLIHGTSDWSYSAWVNFSAITSVGTIFENGSWTSCLLIRFETSGITIYSMSTYWGFFSLSPTLGVWYKLDFIRSGNNILFYLNGSYSQSISFTANIQPSSNLFIGMSQHAAGQCFNGRISQAQVYTRALTAAEIRQNFNAARGRYGV